MEVIMPIPGDNGQPDKERKAQEDRINNVSLTGAELKKELAKMEEKFEF